MTRPYLIRLPAALLAVGIGLLAAKGSLAADPGARQYAKLVSAEADLVSYWRFDADLKDAKGNAHGRARGGRPQFADGPGQGKALVLAGPRFVTMGNTPDLDLKQTTVELWVRPDFRPGVKYNPAIIAKRGQGDHRFTRFSIHLQSDYSRVAVWNGQSVTWYTNSFTGGIESATAPLCDHRSRSTSVPYGTPCESSWNAGRNVPARRRRARAANC